MHAPRETETEIEDCTQQSRWGELSGADPVREQGKQPWVEGEVRHVAVIATEASAHLVGAREPGSPSETPRLNEAGGRPLCPALTLVEAAS